MISSSSTGTAAYDAILAAVSSATSYLISG
jgi:hypothetical protein